MILLAVLLLGFSIASFICGAGIAATRIGKLMRERKFYIALPDHILREIWYRTGAEIDARASRAYEEGRN